MKHWLIGLLALTTLVPMTTWSDNHGDDPLRVMAFNIRYNNPNDGIDAWPNRKDYVAATIHQLHDVDIVGLQEALKEQIDDLAERLPEYEWFGVGRDDGEHAGEHCAIFYKPERLEQLDHGTFWLSETPSVPGSKSWDSSITRIVTWGTFRDRASGETFAFLNTHYDHRGQEAREESSKLILRKTAEIAGDLPTILLGDFNATEENPAYLTLVGKEKTDGTQVSYMDARYAPGIPPVWTKPTSTSWDSIRLDRLAIDHIFVRNAVKVHYFEPITSTFNGRYPSDHLPVFAIVSFP